ncbi:MAG: HAMP domain-containing histidine kinase, partial [Rhizobiales bacterium]|nr:HAMP domain-containing histidine kinase [Hyphomicrobiales bacterium]
MFGNIDFTALSAARFGGAIAANAMREEITMTAHDLRNPLACLVSTLELLETKAPGSAQNDVTNTVRRGLRAAERMESMILRLLENARQQSGILKAKKSVSSLRSVAEAAIELSLPNAQSKAISITLSGQDVFVEADEDLLIEAVDNLVSNAVKYSHPETAIFCELGQDANSIFIRIMDQGQGLSQHDLERVGQPFQQLSAKPTAGEESIGL